MRLRQAKKIFYNMVYSGNNERYHYGYSLKRDKLRNPIPWHTRDAAGVKFERYHKKLKKRIYGY